MTTTFIVTEAFAASVLEIKNPWFIVGKDGGPVILGVFAGRAAARAANAPPNGLAGKIVSLNEITLKTVAPIAAVEEPKAKRVKAEAKPIENRSTVESPCRLVWDLADKMTGAARKDVIAAAQEKGVAFYTARTQYQLWRQVQKEMAEREAAAKK